MGLLDNKLIKDLALKQLKNYMSEEGVKMIAVYIDENGEFKFNEYKEPVIVMTTEARDSAMKIVADMQATIENYKSKLNHEHD